MVSVGTPPAPSPTRREYVHKMGHHGRFALRVALLLAVTAVLPATAAAAPTPLGRSCADQNGVRFCPGTVANRVPSFDGVPLDVDVTLPPASSGDGPFPTIVMMHGYGGDKTDFEQDKPEGDKQPSEAPSSATLYHWNNTYFAQRGYAVLNYTARGFGESCGSEASRAADLAGCAEGWIRLADQRREAHDTQYLLGKLVNQNLSKPDALGVTGISYGGGQSMELAFLRNRIRNPGGTFSPWVSPSDGTPRDGTPLSIAAAFPRWPWSDLVASLVPNGRFLDTRTSSDAESRDPLGVPIQSYIAGLYAKGQATGYYSPPGTDPTADLTTWNGVIAMNEPSQQARDIADEIFTHHQAFGLPLDSPPAPLLIENGWTDDLFPPSEALRVYNQLRASNAAAPVSLQFGDLGHARGSNKVNSDKAFNDQGSAFMDQYLKAGGPGPAPGSVTAYTQTCPQAAPAGGPFAAASWPQVHPGSISFGGTQQQTVSSDGGNPATGQGLDPISGGGDACKDFAEESASGTAVYRGNKSAGYTVLGRPTVTAAVQTTGVNGQLDARLWDVSESGRQVLITRGIYRLRDNETGTITFQLNGNGYRLASGHTPKLELLGRDEPYYRRTNESFTVKLGTVDVSLPTVEPNPASLPAASPPSGGSTPATGARRTPKLIVHLKYSKKRRVLSTSGRLIRPSDVVVTRACKGRVSIQVKAGKRTISTRRASVRQFTCRFASKVRFKVRKRFGKARRLKVSVRYGGNAFLNPVRAKNRLVRVR